MNEILVYIVKDLPSTALLILVLFSLNKQFNNGLKMLGNHIKSTNRLLEVCIKGRQLEERMDEMALKLVAAEKALSQQLALADEKKRRRK